MRFAERLIWGVLIVGALAFAGTAWRAFMPGTYWLVVDRLVIPDLTEGDPVVMELERTIKRPFQADWIVTLRVSTPKGLEQVCEARGASNYLTTAVLPRPLTLHWWMGREPVACPMPPGQYVVDAVWIIDDGIWGSKPITFASRVFTVFPRSQAP